MSAVNRKLRRAAFRHALELANDIQGCNCDRIITLHGVDHAVTQHDDDCPMRDAGKQYIVFQLPKGCSR